jgi:thioesterase domain-containing protein
VIDRTALCNELTATWRREIPIAAAMGVAAEAYDGRSLTVRAPLQPNVNLHGTAFAGSLFSACVLTGWGRVWLALRERGLTGVIYAADSAIRYRKAVVGDLVCRCEADSDALEDGLENLAATGRASFALECTIPGNDKPAVGFTCTYVVHTKRD